MRTAPAAAMLIAFVSLCMFQFGCCRSIESQADLGAPVAAGGVEAGDRYCALSSFRPYAAHSSGDRLGIEFELRSNDQSRRGQLARWLTLWHKHSFSPQSISVLDEMGARVPITPYAANVPVREGTQSRIMAVHPGSLPVRVISGTQESEQRATILVTYFVGAETRIPVGSEITVQLRSGFVSMPPFEGEGVQASPKLGDADFREISASFVVKSLEEYLTNKFEHW